MLRFMILFSRNQNNQQTHAALDFIFQALNFFGLWLILIFHQRKTGEGHYETENEKCSQGQSSKCTS